MTDPSGDRLELRPLSCGWWRRCAATLCAGTAAVAELFSAGRGAACKAGGLEPRQRHDDHHHVTRPFGQHRHERRGVRTCGELRERAPL